MSTQLRAFGGCAALAAYLVLFAAGMLIDSRHYRDDLRLQAGVASAAQAEAVPAEQAEEAAAIPAVAAGPSARMHFSRAFFGSLLLYTPTNVAVLTLLAAFIGGCASNLTFVRGEQQIAEKAEAAGRFDARAAASELFRSENPFASMFRGLLVYLAFMTGLFIATSEPFQNPTSEQYVRFAGTISFFAFVIGYDPTKFQSFLDLLPRRGGKPA